MQSDVGTESPGNRTSMPLVLEIDVRGDAVKASLLDHEGQDEL